MTGSPQTLGSRLRQLRQQRGITQGDLATLAQVSRTTLAHLEADKTTAQGATLSRLAAALNLPLATLVTGEGYLPDPATLPKVDTGSNAGSIEPSQLAAARFQFDSTGNPAVDRLAHRRPDLFVGWSPQEWDELVSAFGSGGELTDSGAEELAESINQNMTTLYQLRVVLGTHLRDVARKLIATLHDEVQVKSPNSKP
jgi:transcriptional regulator with XRE-family HTH domain